MHIFVGSHNPVKINAVVGASSETWPEVIVEGFDVPSGIAEQPLSDMETKTGAINRAKAALYDGLAKYDDKGAKFDNEQAVGVGLEGGIFEDQEGKMWSTVWAAVIDQEDYIELANGARFQVPEIVSEQIRTGGEMGPIISQIVGETDVRKKQGMIGVITKNFIDRTEEYQIIIKMALGLWYGRNWLNEVK
jgi:inosine/xanthosine triphosphatase